MGKARCPECGHGEGDESETQALYARIEALEAARKEANEVVERMAAERDAAVAARGPGIHRIDARFVQMFWEETTLHGLDEDGNVWFLRSSVVWHPWRLRREIDG
jgi:hypothetical protein